MNGHIIPRTPEEIAEREAPYRADLAAWPDMAQMPEPEERKGNGTIATFATWAAVVAVVVAWIIAGRIW